MWRLLSTSRVLSPLKRPSQSVFRRWVSERTPDLDAVLKQLLEEPEFDLIRVETIVRELQVRLTSLKSPVQRRIPAIPHLLATIEEPCKISTQQLEIELAVQYR